MRYKCNSVEGRKMILISVGCNQKHEERRGDEGRGDM